MAKAARAEFTVKTAEDQRRLKGAIDTGAIIVDPGRRRPFYFDGRFLTAGDLIADQDYIRARQSDLAQAIGAGVISGLMVSLGRGAAADNVELVIEPGLGTTPSGDLVVIGAAQQVPLNVIPETQVIDSQLGIKLLPTAGTVNRSGLYVLALRPVEFSSNPTPSYPTTLDGSRSVHDGDIIEATAITLIPYPDRAGAESAEAKRARVTREIFFDGQRPGALQEALPLAMLYVEGGALRWLDVFMVRREIGAESTLAAGLRQRPRGQLEAWLKQHQDQVEDIGPAAVEQGFAATRYFEVLPPVGLCPSSALKFDTQLGSPTLTQSFFPPLVDCEFAFVPSDEIAVLIDEALALPPIDLSGSDEDLDHLSLLIVAPVTRRKLEQLTRDLENVTRTVRAAAPGMIAKRLPLESLLRITVPQTVVIDPLVRTRATALTTAWSTALADAQNTVKQSNRGCFWYLRRRQLPYYSELSSATLRLAGTASALDAELNRRLTADQALGTFTTLTGRMPRLAVAETVNLLAAPRLALTRPTTVAQGLPTGDVLRRSAFAALTAIASQKGTGPVEHADVLQVARDFSHPRLGEGFDALNQAADAETRTTLSDPKATAAIAESGVAPQLDRAATLLPAPALRDFAQRVATAAVANDLDGLRGMVSEPFKNTVPQ